MKLNNSQKKVIASHKNKNWTRRDFMALGLHSFAGYALAQPFCASIAHAQTLAVAAPAFLVFDLVGGAALPGNFLVGGSGGSNDLISSYDTLGFNPRTASLDSRFGLPAPKDISRMFEGMISVMSPEAQSKFKLSSIAHQAVDDSNTNLTSALGLVAKYWEANQLLSQKGFGVEGTNSGGRTRLSLDEPQLRPEQLTNVNQLNLLKGLGYLNAAGMTDTAITDLLNFQKNNFLFDFKGMSSGEQLSLVDKFKSKFDTIIDSQKNAMELDPRKIESVRNLYSINENAQATDVAVVMSGIVQASLVGVSGPSCLALGGYDYHDGTQATGDQRDFEAGQAIGRSVELAHRMNKSLFIQILTDGSCASSLGGREWVADSGDRTLTLIGCYNPSGVKQVKTQVGHYTNGGIAESETYVGRRTENVANIVYLNYLSSFGREADVTKLVTSLDKETIDMSVTFTT